MKLPEQQMPKGNGQPGEGGESFRWRVRLSDKAPEKRAGVVVAALFAMVLGWLVFRSPAMGIVGFAIIFGSTAEYWLGATYKVDEKGASARTGFSLVSMEWADVKRVIWEKNGVRLSPLENAGTMDAFRGVFLRYGDGNREDIERAVLNFGDKRGQLNSGPDAGREAGTGREGGERDLPPGDANAGDHDAGDA